MVFFYILIILFITIIFISYPLFLKKIEPIIKKSFISEENEEKIMLLSSILDLEDEFLLGKLSEKDFKKQKLIIQRKYLKEI